MKKFLLVCVCAIFAMSILVACTSTQSLSFHATTGDDVTVSLIQDNNKFRLKYADDKASCYVTYKKKPVFQTDFLTKDTLHKLTDKLGIISKGVLNGCDYICYVGDVGKPCYFITVSNSNTVVQLLNSGSYSNSTVKDAVRHALFYVGDKPPKREFTETIVDSKEASANAKVKGSEKVYGKIGDTVSYKVGKDIKAGSYTVSLVGGNACTAQLTPKSADGKSVAVSHKSLVKGKSLSMGDGDTLTVTNGLVTLK